MNTGPTAGPNQPSGPVPSGTLPPERLRSVLHRLATGFYDQVEIRDVIAVRARAELV